MKYCWILIGAIGCLFSCTDNTVKDLDNLKLEDKAGIERATGIELLYSDSAIVKVRIKAPLMLKDDNNKKPKKIFPDGIGADFFDDNQKQTSKLLADYAEQYPDEQKFYLRDNIHIWNIENEHLEGKELIWNEREKRIYSDSFVRITTPTQIITGYKLESNLSFTEWKLDSVQGITESKNLVDTPF